MSTIARQFEGKILAVTGGASGIGAACVRLLAGRGAKVAIMDINMKQAEVVAAETGGIAIEVDVASEESIDAAVEAIETGMGPVSGVITSAGIVQTPVPPDELSTELYDKFYTINQRGTFLTLRSFARGVVQRREGSMVALSSVTARRSVPLHAYAPGKAAITNLTMCLAGEWGRAGLRVNAIEPGYTRTPAVQEQIDGGHRDPAEIYKNSTLGRMVEPEEVAKTAAFLLSDEASAVTGVSMAVDAGYYCAGTWAIFGGVRQY